MSDTVMLSLYESMLKIRLTEQLLMREYSGNLLKTPLHLANGSEAIPCGVLNVIKDARVYGTYRNHHWFLELTESPESLFLELLGKQSSPNEGRAGSMHLSFPEKGMILTSAIVSSTLSIALGDAWAGTQSAEKTTTIAFFGDGATEEGVFFETLNFAALKKIPLLFVCEDNELAIHSKKSSRHAFNLKDTVESFGIPYFYSEAYHVDEVVSVVKQAQIQLSSGPVFLHLKYFRMLAHVGPEADFDQGYRSEPIDAKEMDPILNLEKKLKMSGVSVERLTEIREKIQTLLDSTYEKCLTAPDADPNLAHRYVFSGKTHE